MVGVAQICWYATGYFFISPCQHVKCGSFRHSSIIIDYCGQLSTILDLFFFSAFSYISGEVIWFILLFLIIYVYFPLHLKLFVIVLFYFFNL